LSQKDYNKILKESKNALIDFLNVNVKNDIDGVSYIKWCRDKFIINKKDVENDKLIQNAIYWVDFGIGIGSELRKLRPAILWRPTSDKNLWTMIPLTTKRRSDKYYFHIDLECLTEGTAKIENMMNLSSKRILSPYFAKDKLAIISNNDYKEIKKAISKYYLFK
jgi:mRNA-degrading endonuclease toxin of MazEF toxin-antitoxin module